MENNIFESTQNYKKTLAGVFEFDDGVGYFYLYDLNKEEGKKIIDSIFISKDFNDFAKKTVSVRWSNNQENVGLFVNDDLWAVFIINDMKKYHKNDLSVLGLSVSDIFI